MNEEEEENYKRGSDSLRRRGVLIEKLKVLVEGGAPKSGGGVLGRGVLVEEDGS